MEKSLSVDWINCTKELVGSGIWRQNSHSYQSTSLTGVHDQVSSDLGLPVVPRRLEALGEADAEVLEVAFAHEGLGGAGGDQRALNGQDQSGARVEVDGVVGLMIRDKGEEEEETREESASGSTWYCEN